MKTATAAQQRRADERSVTIKLILATRKQPLRSALVALADRMAELDKAHQDAYNPTITRKAQRHYALQDIELLAEIGERVTAAIADRVGTAQIED